MSCCCNFLFGKLYDGLNSCHCKNWLFSVSVGSATEISPCFGIIVKKTDCFLFQWVILPRYRRVRYRWCNWLFFYFSWLSPHVDIVGETGYFSISAGYRRASVSLVKLIIFLFQLVLLQRYHRASVSLLKLIIFLFQLVLLQRYHRASVSLVQLVIFLFQLVIAACRYRCWNWLFFYFSWLSPRVGIVGETDNFSVSIGIITEISPRTASLFKLITFLFQRVVLQRYRRVRYRWWKWLSFCFSW